MTGDGRYILGEHELQIAERDGLIISVWTVTYQEVGNNRKLFFTTITDAADENATTGVISGLGISRYNVLNYRSQS
jgi:hypothetical protein